MPKPLLARLRPDSIAEFRLAARARYQDGEAAADQDRRTAAIYLWGYVVEMLLKAAYFEVDGLLERDPISIRDLKTAVKFGVTKNILWPPQGQLHNIRAWGETLVARRQMHPASVYQDVAFEQEVLIRSGRLESIWSETLRYHPNVAYPHEFRQVRSSAEWFVVHSPFL